jgi:hypothetical protein
MKVTVVVTRAQPKGPVRSLFISQAGVIISNVTRLSGGLWAVWPVGGVG